MPKENKFLKMSKGNKFKKNLILNSHSAKFLPFSRSGLELRQLSYSRNFPYCPKARDGNHLESKSK